MDGRNDNDGEAMIAIIAIILFVLIWNLCERNRDYEIVRNAHWIAISLTTMIVLFLMGITVTVMDANYKAPEPVKILTQKWYTDDITLSSTQIQEVVKAESDDKKYTFIKYEQPGTTETNMFIWPLSIERNSKIIWEVKYENRN